jgi:hypothetical protein
LQLATILRALHDDGELGTVVTLAAVRHGDAVGLSELPPFLRRLPNQV